MIVNTVKITVGMLKSIIREALEKRAAKVPNILYHVTSERNVESVLRQGLQPRHNPHWNMPEPAVFFMDDLDAAIDMYDMIGHPGRVEAFIVHVDRLPPETKFYEDLDAGKGAFWSPDPIPVTALEQVIFDD